MKKNLLTKFCSALCCFLLSTTLYGQEIEIVIDDFNYILHEDGSATFAGIMSKNLPETLDKEGEIIIPASVSHEGKDYQVTEIGWYAFQELNKITSVSIPNSVTKIGMAAFEGCSSISSITVPEGVTTIEDNVFNKCTSLANITIPKSVETIGLNVFNRTEWYNNLPSGEIYIGHILYGYKGIMQKETAIQVKEGTTYIAKNAFERKGLVSVTLPSSLKKIDSGAFNNCPKLTEITLPQNLEYIGANAFKGTKIKTITIPASVSYIEDFISQETEEIRFLSSTPPENNGFNPLTISKATFYIPFHSFIQYYKAQLIPQNNIGDFFSVKTLEGENIYAVQTDIINPEENGGKILMNGKDTNIIGALLGAKDINIKVIANEGYTINYIQFNGEYPIYTDGLRSFEYNIPSVYKYTKIQVQFISAASISDQTIDDTRVYTSERMIKIENVNEIAPVIILNLAGQPLYQGTTDTYEAVSLPSGMYLVKVGTETHKVVIK